MQKVVLSLLLFTSSCAAFADSAPIVIYFGGVGSTKPQIDACYVTSENYGYPVSANVQASLIAKIKANPTQRYILAGHSAGSTTAIAVATQAGVVNPSRLTLVDLDGFVPKGVPSKIRRVCWDAKRISTTGEVISVSRGFPYLKNARSVCEVKTHEDHHCSTSSPWCLHFSLVNPDTAANLQHTTTGYDGCNPYQTPEWLQDALDGATPTDATDAGASAPVQFGN
jgi:hypothetical protein